MIEVTVYTKQGRKHRDEVDDALKEFKKQVKKSGLMNELRRREHHVPPSRARKLKRDESLKQRKRDAKKSLHQKNSNNF